MKLADQLKLERKNFFDQIVSEAYLYSIERIKKYNESGRSKKGSLSMQISRDDIETALNKKYKDRYWISDIMEELAEKLRDENFKAEFKEERISWYIWVEW